MTDSTCVHCLSAKHIRCRGNCACTVCASKRSIKSRKMKESSHDLRVVPKQRPLPRKIKNASPAWPEVVNPPTVVLDHPPLATELVGPARQVAAIMFRLGANEFEVVERFKCTLAAARKIRDESGLSP